MWAKADDVLFAAYHGGIATRSDLARSHAEVIAACACLGFITTLERDGSWGRTWRCTPSGVDFYWVGTRE